MAVDVVVEEHVSLKAFLRNRIRKLGFSKVASQVAFMTTINPILKRVSKKRLKEIIAAHDLDLAPPSSPIKVDSVNSRDTIEAIKRLQPNVIVVNGTRIISRDVLNCTSVPFINIHAGITPAYRGAHGGYWALYENRPEQCGVTVHLVDPGIDTGEVIGQALIMPTKSDNFTTYPFLQLAAALPILGDAITRALNRSLTFYPVFGRTAIWYHPGLLQYLLARLRGVR